ncbi:MAG TPA: YncE family protein [Amycolatopsis sp.]|nr:YncE family protein [Amycolatopsis sp.]
MIVNRRRLFVLVAGLGLPPVAAAAAGPRVTTVEVGSAPGPVAVNSTTGTVYVACDGTVMTTGGGIIPTAADDLAVDESSGRVYTTNRRAGTVTVFDADGELRSVVPCGPGAAVLDVDDASSRLYVGSASAASVGVVDTIASILDTLLHGSGQGYAAVRVDSGRQVAYLSSPAGNTVDVLDLASGEFTASIPVGRSPVGLAVHQATNTVYVANAGIHHLSVVDGGAHTERETILLRSEASSVAVHEDSNTVYCNGGPDGIVKIDGTTAKIVGELSLGINPGQVAVDQRTKTIYVSDPVHGLLHTITDF